LDVCAAQKTVTVCRCSAEFFE